MKFSNKDLIKKGYDVEKNRMLVISFNRVMKRIVDNFNGSSSDLYELKKHIKTITELVIIYQGTCIFNNEKPILEIEKFIEKYNSQGDNKNRIWLTDELIPNLQEASRKAFLLGRMDLNIPKVIKDTIAENIALIENVAIQLQPLK